MRRLLQRPTEHDVPACTWMYFVICRIVLLILWCPRHGARLGPGVTDTWGRARRVLCPTEPEAAAIWQSSSPPWPNFLYRMSCSLSIWTINRCSFSRFTSSSFYKSRYLIYDPLCHSAIWLNGRLITCKCFWHQMPMSSFIQEKDRCPIDASNFMNKWF